MTAKSQLSRDDLDYIQQQASRLHGEVKIALPGYEIIYRTQHESATKGHVVTYVNGQWLGYWLSAKRPSPEQQFLRRVERPCYTSKRKSEIVKWFGKRKALQHFPDLHGRFAHFDVCWPSWRPLIVHIKRLSRLYPNLEVVRRQP